MTACRKEACVDDFCYADAVSISFFIEHFTLETGSIPTASEGLDILVNRPTHLQSDVAWEQITSKLPTDPWKQPFHYVPNTTSRPQTFSIISWGRDGKPSADDRVFSFTVECSQH
jgi:type II secretion system protein G